MVLLFDSLVAPLSVVNAPEAALCGEKSRRKMMIRWENVGKIWDEYQVYKKAMN